MEPITGGCHCGAVRFRVASKPLYGLTTCNCSICRRYGALRAHHNLDEVSISTSETSTFQYIWGHKALAFHTCRTCGCTTHYMPVEGIGSTMMGVNYNLVDDTSRLADFPTRDNDGAGTETF